ncbi:Rv1815 family serine proteinase [Mycolicibacterium sp. XJ1819]
MRRRWGRVLAAAVAPMLALIAPSATQADPGVLVHPGMEVIQGTNVCTLGFVDIQARVAYTAGHCRGDGTVRDNGGKFVGSQASFRDNTPDGATIDTNHQITDWQAISLAPDVMVNDILPGGRVLVSDPATLPAPGLPVCHYGVITKESCGTIEAVHNGWFTMANGIVSQKGDSGGPVYAITPDGRAAIVGMFNSTWGQFPAAVSWQVASQQAREDVISAASAETRAVPASIPHP